LRRSRNPLAYLQLAAGDLANAEGFAS